MWGQGRPSHGLAGLRHPGGCTGVLGADRHRPRPRRHGGNPLSRSGVPPRPAPEGPRRARLVPVAGGAPFHPRRHDHGPRRDRSSRRQSGDGIRRPDPGRSGARGHPFHHVLLRDLGLLERRHRGHRIAHAPGDEAQALSSPVRDRARRSRRRHGDARASVHRPDRHRRGCQYLHRRAVCRRLPPGSGQCAGDSRPDVLLRPQAEPAAGSADDVEEEDSRRPRQRARAVDGGDHPRRYPGGGGAMAFT